MDGPDHGGDSGGGHGGADIGHDGADFGHGFDYDGDHEFEDHSRDTSGTFLNDQHSNVEMDHFAGTRRPFDLDAANDQLMLSYDHCVVFDGGQTCEGGGYRLVDAVRGTFEDDVYDPDGSVSPVHTTHQLTPKQLEIVKAMAADPRRRMYGVHVTNHGLIHLKDEFKRIAEACNCVRIDTVTPNFFASDDQLPALADWNIWKPPFSRKKVPAGYYPNATGYTRIWKQYWQVKHPEPTWWEKLFIHYGPKHNPNWRFDRFCNTILEVTCVTWYYREACDYETRFHVRVISLPYLDPHDRRWGYLKEPFAKYQLAAKQLCEQVLRRLKACPPHPVAVKNRGDILKKIREEAEQRRAEAQRERAEKAAAASAVSPPASADGCPVKSGADIGAALSAKPEHVSVKLKLPKRS